MASLGLGKCGKKQSHEFWGFLTSSGENARQDLTTKFLLHEKIVKSKQEIRGNYLKVLRTYATPCTFLNKVVGGWQEQRHVMVPTT